MQRLKIKKVIENVAKAPLLSGKKLAGVSTKFYRLTDHLPCKKLRDNQNSGGALNSMPGEELIVLINLLAPDIQPALNAHK